MTVVFATHTQSDSYHPTFHCTNRSILSNMLRIKAHRIPICLFGEDMRQRN